MAQEAPPPHEATTSSLAMPPSASETTSTPLTLDRFTLGFGLGFVIAGVGTDRSACEGADCGITTAGERSYRYQPALFVQVFGYYQASELLRFGPTVMLVPGSSLRFDGTERRRDADLGTLLSFDAAVEVTPRVSRVTWLLPRLQAGLSTLFPTGDLTSRLDSVKSDCLAGNGAFANCDSPDGPKFGVNVGAGFGVLLAMAPRLRLRFDVTGEYHYFRLFTLTPGTASARYSETVGGSRLIVSAGMEF